ncbi:spherulation-specific family 4 protein [Candidatus Nitrosotalea sp. TS]|uniref:spherulation-specific family 4 protein n=1 Tax=Candidatus Nitrosotalea sp. TS TaxID=2341020 RepID=UPI00140CC309|nr:spherulation-specific family 4 protein [Candidatus Nitrosotalea sp. TS]
MISSRINFGVFSLSWILIISVVCVAILSHPPSADAIQKPTGIIIPLYVYPGPSWDELVKEKVAHPSIPIIAIINPDSGPGTQDPNYNTGVQKLQSAGISVVGMYIPKMLHLTQLQITLTNTKIGTMLTESSSMECHMYQEMKIITNT